ncbi:MULTISPECIES: hypothetical protein [Oceanobacillus]|uniref:hypothetical protein n=1 Tax=Oceanobacillus TaxID=182709 RepID=UPI0025A48564|nr:hypothetical protein [Oceanobacillus oncorhynchi]MDM8101201.1 hypothetical protein [Oceanobacillus oncorhynchi]
MSDFIYSKKNVENGKLTKEIQKIYHDDKPLVKEFHGGWGSLAVSQSLYNGFQPYETKDHLFVVIGGPVLYFQDNTFLKEIYGDIGSIAIYNRWVQGEIKWDEDLSGPFAILIVDKESYEVQVITDLMSFIPIFIYQNPKNTILSTHVDILANVSNQKDNIDIVSHADFILNSIVTFPYTVYNNIHQINPASIHYLSNEPIETNAYWEPKEENKYRSINQAAEELRSSLKEYISRITSEVSNIAQFISGGEDSRTLSALLQGNSRDAFIFLDHMNREGKVAKKAANAYGANFNLNTRTKTHYLEILAACSDLVGSGSQYHHAHTFGFHKTCSLNEYSAVFGGLFSDALLKGIRVKKIRGSKRFPFIPDIKNSNYSPGKSLENTLFTSDILEKLTKRRQIHLEYVKSFRKESAAEWFELWPSSMNMNIPNLHANRRLFRSYEPFMANDIVKLSAAVPQNWKLNRKLFHKSAKPFLKPTKWLIHGDGRLPYFSWYFNAFIQFVFWTSRQVGKRTGYIKGNQGPWGEWNVVLNSSDWECFLDKYSDKSNEINILFNNKDIKEIMNTDKLTIMQKVNLMQVLYQINNRFE